MKKVKATEEAIDSPTHYQVMEGIEAIDLIKAQTAENYSGYLEGNVLKYLFRWRKKNGAEDLKKAKKYLEWLIEEEEC